MAEPANAAEFVGIAACIYRGEQYESWVAGQDGSPLVDPAGSGLAPLRFYTSGTTGRPKAIIRHPGDPTRAAAMQEIMDARLGVVSARGRFISWLR